MNSRNKLVAGVGVNDADYIVAIKTKDAVTGKAKQWICPYYEKWASMLKRCYSEAALKHDPTYTNCIVCEEWKHFSNFKSWMEKQEWKGKQLDKDILGDSKLYSPETCTFVSLKVNLFLKGNYQNKYLPGVIYAKGRNRYRAQIYDIRVRKRKIIGSFKTQEEAHDKWKELKLELAYSLIKEENLPENVAKALVDKVINI